ncbi:MAG: tyrosine-type recombinase/integrase [Acidimicrobiales bacterium]
MRRTLVTGLNEAVARGRLVRNPAKLAVRHRQVEPEIEPLSIEDARTILTGATDERNGLAWVIAVSLGLRRGEVLGLRWDDVDLAEGTLTVRRALSRLPWRHGCDGTCGRKRGAECPDRHGGGLVFDEPKSRAGHRTLVVPAPLVAGLKVHRQRQVEDQLQAEWWDETGLVFSDAWGRPLDPDRHTKAWNAFLDRCGVRQARLHDARHTAATLLLVQGVDPRVVMDLMGWSHVAMTKRYQHVVPELRRVAAERMTEALWPTTATRTATRDGDAG